MASSQKTTAYALSQWAEDDPVLRQDFNADNKILDEALAQMREGLTKLQPICGTYTGNASERSVCLGFRPSWVLVMPSGGYYNTSGGLEFAMASWGTNACNLSLTSTGFTVKGGLNYANSTSSAYVNKNPYHYIALR